MSLHDACVKIVGYNPSVNISKAYNGGDEFLRQMMRVGNLFEAWACEHIAFEELNDVWPYLLQDRFGAACLETTEAGSLGSFDSDDCLRVACGLRLPMRADGSLPLPVCIEAANPLARATFSQLRIQTIREVLGADGEVVPFVEDDDPFDENYGQPFFGIYGVRDDGRLEHIADSATYQEARDLLVNLLPGIGFPTEVIAYARPLTPLGGSSCP